MSFVTTLLIAMAVPATLRWIYTRATTGRARVEAGAITFPESRAVPVIRWAGVSMCMVFGFGSWWYGGRLSIALGFGAFALLTFIFARGDPIIITDQGISGASTWGRTASLAWGDVISVELNKAKSTVMVIGRNGAKICHSGFHFDRRHFEEEVRRRSGLQLKVIEPGIWRSKISYR